MSDNLKAFILESRIHVRFSSIPVFSEIIHEGFVHLWQEESTNWQLVWACLKNGTLKFSADSRAKSESIFEMVILGSLRATEASRRRANSIQLRDNERKIIMAAPHKDDMKDWIHLIRKHKNHLRRCFPKPKKVYSRKLKKNS